MMHCSNRNSKKEKKTLRSLKFNPSVDSPHICTRKLDLLSKGDRLQNRKIYSAHVYRPPHLWCRRTDTQCNTVPLYRQCIDLAEYTVLFYSRSSLVLVVAALWLGRTWKVGDEKCNRSQSESGVSISSKNGVFFIKAHFEVWVFISMQNWVQYKKR